MTLSAGVHDYIRRLVSAAEEKGLVVLELDGTSAPYTVELTPEGVERGPGDSVRVKIEGVDPLGLLERLPDFSVVDKPVDTVEKFPRAPAGESGKS